MSSKYLQAADPLEPLQELGPAAAGIAQAVLAVRRLPWSRRSILRRSGVMAAAMDALARDAKAVHDLTSRESAQAKSPLEIRTSDP